MAKTKKTLATLITFVQDETGSMSMIYDATISAFNEYFAGLKKEKNVGDVSVLVMQFSDAAPEERVRIMHDGPLAKVPKLTATNYRPRGITPLLDAVGTAITQAEIKKVDRHLFIVQTDGQENASRDFTLEKVAQLVSDKEALDNWTVVFLGAGVSQWMQEAVRMGARAASSYGYSPDATGAVYRAAGQTTSEFLASTDPADKSFASKTKAKAETEQTRDKKSKKK